MKKQRNPLLEYCPIVNTIRKELCIIRNNKNLLPNMYYKHIYNLARASIQSNCKRACNANPILPLGKLVIPKTKTKTILALR